MFVLYRAFQFTYGANGGRMKVVHRKKKVTLLMRLKEEADTETLKVEQETHRVYELRKYKWFWIWDTIARIDTYKETIVVRELIWKKHEDLIKRLAIIVEDYNKRFTSIVIEVRP